MDLGNGVDARRIWGGTVIPLAELGDVLLGVVGVYCQALLRATVRRVAGIDNNVALRASAGKDQARNRSRCRRITCGGTLVRRWRDSTSC